MQNYDNYTNNHIIYVHILVTLTLIILFSISIGELLRIAKILADINA